MSAATANLTLETAFSTMDASVTLQAAFRDTVKEFMNDPLKIIAPPAAPITKKTSEKLTPKSVKIQESSEKKREEIILKSFEAKIERKKREVKDKYRKRRCTMSVVLDVLMCVGRLSRLNAKRTMGNCLLILLRKKRLQRLQNWTM